jgi:hypothetical protein
MLGQSFFMSRQTRQGALYTNGITRQAPGGKGGGAGWTRSETKRSSELKLWSGPAQTSTGRDLTARTKVGTRARGGSRPPETRWRGCARSRDALIVRGSLIVDNSKPRNQETRARYGVEVQRWN